MKKFSTDVYLIARNELLIQLRNPLWLVFGLFQPIVYLVLLTPFLAGVSNLSAIPGQSAMQFFTPGILVMNILFGAGFAGFGLIDKLRSGFIERVRVTPVSRVAIVLGLVLRVPVVQLIQSALLVSVALVFGFRMDVLGALVLTALMIIMCIMMASLSCTIALLVKDEGMLAAVTNVFTLPLMILSGIMLPITFASPAIRRLSKLDPFTYGVDAARALLNSSLNDAAITHAFVIFTTLALLALLAFIKAMREAVA